MGCETRPVGMAIERAFIAPHWLSSRWPEATRGASSRGASSAKCMAGSAFDQRRSHVGTRRFFLDACVCRLISPPPALVRCPSKNELTL